MHVLPRDDTRLRQSLTVSYEDDLGINLGLTASAQRAGMKLGGKFEDHQNTVWQIVGKFSSAIVPKAPEGSAEQEHRPFLYLEVTGVYGE